MRAVRVRTWNKLLPAVHIAHDDKSLCGVPQRGRGGVVELQDTLGAVTCKKCLRHHAREIGRMVEHKLRDAWDVSVGNGGW